jgi:drug/metabolite transporter (DMT)-like permease
MVATVYTAFALREKIGGAGWLALLMSFIGVIMIATKGRGFHIQNGQGVLLYVAGAVCYGVFNVCNKKKGLDQYFCTTVYFSVTAICSGIVFGMTEKFTPMSMKAWVGMIWLGVFIDALAILAWGLALQKTDIGFLSNFAYMTPVAAMVISFVLLGEQIEFYSILGMLFIVGGCFLRLLAEREKIHLMQRKKKQRIQ